VNGTSQQPSLAWQPESTQSTINTIKNNKQTNNIQTSGHLEVAIAQKGC
jgi:hypothetical protein